MLVPLLHHGCVITGIPYSENALNTTRIDLAGIVDHGLEYIPVAG